MACPLKYNYVVVITSYDHTKGKRGAFLSNEVVFFYLGLTLQETQTFSTVQT